MKNLPLLAGLCWLAFSLEAPLWKPGYYALYASPRPCLLLCSVLVFYRLSMVSLGTAVATLRTACTPHCLLPILHYCYALQATQRLPLPPGQARQTALRSCVYLGHVAALLGQPLVLKKHLLDVVLQQRSHLQYSQDKPCKPTLDDRVVSSHCSLWSSSNS